MTSLRPLSRPVVRQQGTDVGDATVKALLDGGRSDPNAWRFVPRRRPLSRGCLAGIAAGIDGVRPAAIRRGTAALPPGGPDTERIDAGRNDMASRTWGLITMRIAYLMALKGSNRST
ncbi:hypothetical protein ACWDBO_52125 [Streptomyces mirabilis]|uniref:hypothetical protein n=1 Tax=Streptomyces mirabilis TaxID=68239 RepID=UPI0029B2239A|nr:hypothetical protein [Streptomyces sp. AK02-04a]